MKEVIFINHELANMCFIFALIGFLVAILNLGALSNHLSRKGKWDLFWIIIHSVLIIACIGMAIAEIWLGIRGYVLF